MAPTSDERREVAARLRERAQLSNFCPFESFFVRLNVIIFGDNGWDRTDGGVFERLADLIDPQERTCHNSAPYYLRFHCSECHYVIYHDDVNETGEPEEDGINFCPNCGARVTRGGER